MTRLQAVTKALRRFVPSSRLDQRRIAVRVVSYQGELYVLLNQKRWTVGAGRFTARDSMDGCIGGFNIFAINAAHALESLGALKSGDADAFEAWFRATERRASHDRELRQLRELAARHGFALTKRGEGK